MNDFFATPGGSDEPTSDATASDAVTSMPAPAMPVTPPTLDESAQHLGLGPVQQPRFFAAVGLGVVASVVLAYAWGEFVARSGWQIGWLAIGIGVGVAYAVAKGARSVAPAYQFLAAGITAVTLVLGEFFTVRAIFIREFELVDVPLFASPSDIVMTAVESVKIDPITLLFWGIAVFASWRTFDGMRESAAPSSPEPGLV